MIAPDVNLLLYAYDSDSEFHAEASRYWSDALSSPDPVGIPIQCIWGFLRIITHPKAGLNRMPMPDALEIVDEWLQLPQVKLLLPSERHWKTFRDMIKDSRAMGAFVSDAAIAATVIECGAVLHTNDHGFARFEGLRWSNPLRGLIRACRRGGRDQRSAHVRPRGPRSSSRRCSATRGERERRSRRGGRRRGGRGWKGRRGCHR